MRTRDRLRRERRLDAAVRWFLAMFRPETQRLVLEDWASGGLTKYAVDEIRHAYRFQRSEK